MPLPSSPRFCECFYIALCLIASFIFLPWFLFAAETETEYKVEHPAVVGEEFIFTEAPFQECHASTIVQLPKSQGGGLVAAWFGGTSEKNPDVGIWASRRVDGKWTAPVEVVNGVQSPEMRYPCWNPVLFQPSNGPLMLFFKVGPSPSEWWGELIVSTDGGQTWADRRKLPDGFLGPIKNKPIEMKDGSIWCPSSSEDDGWRVHLEVTPDQGKTWRKIGPLNDGHKIKAIQPSILRYGEKRLQLLCRDERGLGNIWQVWSEDGGRTWGEFSSTGLPNPNSGTDAVTLADGRQLLVYNNAVRSGPWPSGREILNVATSLDGKRWTAGPTLEKKSFGWEFSYPAVIQTTDGLVHITYTWDRKRVKHVTLDPKNL